VADILNQDAVTLLAEYILGVAPSDPVPLLGLFVNNVTIACTTDLADLTFCSAPGYAPITLVPGTWTIPAPVACVVDASYGLCEFTMTGNGGGQIVYGHVVYDTVLGILWGLTWATPWTIPSAGGVAQVFPFYTSKQC
jgi:hypothetical protein